MKVREPISHILVAEDDPDDVELLTEAFRATGADLDLQIVHDGEETLTAVRRDTPALLILDLNMPLLSGQEVLNEMKADEHLQKVPVVVMTSTDSQYEIDRAYDAGAASVIQKPKRASELDEIVKGLLQYWCNVVILPPQRLNFKDITGLGM